MSRSLFLFAVVALALAQKRPAEHPPDAPPAPAPDTVIRINVNLVQVDAVVTDSKDKPVTDLTAEDFIVLQDGKPQVITNFAYMTTARPTSATAPKVQAPKKGTPPPPPSNLKPADVQRTIALVVDDLGLSFESTVRVRDSLKKFVEQEMRPGDLVAVIRTGAGMGALQQFTSDKRMLYAAIDRVKFNAFGRVGVSSFAPLGSDDGGSATFTQERNEIFSVGTLGAVRYVVDGLHELPGRKAVILFSEHMQLFNADGQSQRVMDSVRHLTDAANRASVVIYTIDPRGLQVHGLTAADNTNGMSQEQIANVSSERSQQEFQSRDGLVLLAQDTGGLFLANTNDISGALHKAVEDTAGYYLIGYHPDASTFDPRTGQPKFHRVSVRLKRPGLRVRSRSGFFGNSDRGPVQVAHTRQAEIAHALTSPFATGAIHVRLTPLYTEGPKGSLLNTIVYIDGRDLKFTDEPDGWHKAVIDVVAITFGDNGQAEDSSDRTYTLRARGESYEQALKGLLYRVAHPVKKAGAYQMRVVVRDATSEEVGSASQFIEVPDVRKGHLTLSSIILKEAPPVQLQAKPDAPEGAEGQVPTNNVQGSVAVRSFQQGDALLYGYEILNAQADAQKNPQLVSQTRLFRDGKQVYEGKENALAMAGQLDPKRLVAGGSMKLSPQMAPGDYVLQVIVTDKLAKEKYRVATQSMDFEVK